MAEHGTTTTTTVTGQLLPTDESLHACLDLVARTGATEFQIGYLHDGHPETLSWYARVQYRDERITVADHLDPNQAAEALAEKLLGGAKCRCGRLAVLAAGSTVPAGSAMTDGSSWTTEEAAAAGQCIWRRDGPRWTSECDTAVRIPQHQLGREFPTSQTGT